MESTAKSSNTLTSSEDEDKQDCMPMIVNTISLQGHSSALSFDPEPEDEDVSSLLYPACEITESPPSAPPVKDRERKRAKLTSVPLRKPPKGPNPQQNPAPGPSTSRDDHCNVVDVSKLALQERLFKTKELFGTFLRVCQDQESSPEMERVVTKLSRAYDLTRESYLGSMTFQNILDAETDKVNAADTKPWLNLKFVLDEMKSNKINRGTRLKLGDSEDSQEEGEDDKPVIKCPKKRRHLKKLEKTLRQLNLKIKKLEERDVDLDDENSAYVKLDRYRTQFTKVYCKVCEIQGILSDTGRPYLRKVSFAGTTYPHINRCIERYYNKHREFPDFQDIKKLVMVANKQENVEMPPIKVHSMAAAAFKEFGEMLKRLRQYDDYDIIVSYLDDNKMEDPAKYNPDLLDELVNNALLYKNREQEVIDRFAAEDAGLYSVSGQENEIKPKKKRKIIITSPRHKPVLPQAMASAANTKKHLSSSEGSDDEEISKNKKTTKPVSSLSSDSEEDKTVRVKKVSKPVSSLSSSSEDDSGDSESKKRRVFSEKSSVKGKGKEILGKQRIIKRGVKPTKCITPKRTISSDESGPSLNPKDALTNYLGLRTTPKSEQNDAKVKNESDEEIKCIEEIERPVENKNAKSNRRKSSSDSGSSLKSLDIPVMDKLVYESDSEKLNNVNLKNGNADEDSSDSIDIVQEVVTHSKKIIESKNSTSALGKKRLNLSKSKQCLRSKSGSESDNGRASTVTVKTKVDESDSELSTQDLSSDSSDTDVDKKQDVSTIILSEEVPVATKPLTNGSHSNKQPDDSSDSDICILSQEPKAKKVASTRKPSVRRDSSSGAEEYDDRRKLNYPKKIVKEDSSSNSGESEKSTSRWIYAPRKVVNPRDLPFGVNLLPTHSRPLIAPRKVLSSRRPPTSGDSSPASTPPPSPATSTPNRSTMQKTKRRLSSQSNGTSSKRSRLLGSGQRDRARQSTLPQLMNGVARKVHITKVSRPADIPLIELD